MEYLTKLNEEEAKEVARSLWQDSHMQDYLIEKYDYYKTQDNLIMEFEKINKISIEKTMYYDDEYEAPDKTENNFIWYNRHNAPAYRLDEYLKERENLKNNGCAIGGYDYKGIYLLGSYNDNKNMVYCSWADRNNNYFRGEFKRYFTPEEEKAYIELINDRNEQYIQRLKRYWKRYGKHVSTYGYWANR